MPSDEILERLQNFPSRYHWALSDYNLLLAIYGNKPVVRTGRMLILTVLVRISERIGFVWLLILLVGIFELFRELLKQHANKRNMRRSKKVYPTNFFVGFGVAKEVELLGSYSKQNQSKLGLIHQYRTNTFSYWHRVGFMVGVSNLLRAIASARLAMDALPAELKNRRSDFLAHIGSKIGYYAYVHSWFAILTTEVEINQLEVAFSCQNIAAFAAVDAKVRTTYFSHGMITRCELLPAFDSVIALTEEEALFVQRRLPAAQVCVNSAARHVLKPSEMSKEILITSCPIGGDVKYMLSILPMLQWAKAKNIPVRVRLHPAENITFFWFKYVDMGLITIERDGIDFFDAILTIKPRILVSWVSTTLADVLKCGIIPVTACFDDDLHVAELAYPIFQRCLRMPTNFDLIERLLADDVYYQGTLSRLRSRK